IATPSPRRQRLSGRRTNAPTIAAPRAASDAPEGWHPLSEAISAKRWECRACPLASRPYLPDLKLRTVRTVRVRAPLAAEASAAMSEPTDFPGADAAQL